MSIDQTTPKPYFLPWLKPSHRTWPEQAVGASIFLLVSLCFQWLSSWLIQLSLQGEWIERDFFVSWAFSSITSQWGWIVCNILIAAAMWHLWRRHSLKRLKLELSLFLFQLVLQLGWAFTVYFHESLLALMTLLFLCSNALLSTLLFWKKERLSGKTWVASVLWTFYAVGINMALCITNSPRIY